MSALDYQSRLAISDDIYKIIKKEGKTAIMVTHDIAEAISMSDRIIVLSKRPATVKKVYEIKPNINKLKSEFKKIKFGLFFISKSDLSIEIKKIHPVHFVRFRYFF